jgi:hypothetical protein
LKNRNASRTGDLADLVGVNGADCEAAFFSWEVVVWMKFECETPSHPKTPEARQPFSFLVGAPFNICSTEIKFVFLYAKTRN